MRFRFEPGGKGSPAVRTTQDAEPPSISLYKTVSRHRSAFLQLSPLPQPHRPRQKQKKREKMDPSPQVVVVQIKQGKEIGGGNHYCIICRTSTLPTRPDRQSTPDRLPPSITSSTTSPDRKREKMDPAPQIVVIQIKQGKEIGDKKVEKMDPAPQVVVVQIKQGKEIGGDKKKRKDGSGPTSYCYPDQAGQGDWRWQPLLHYLPRPSVILNDYSPPTITPSKLDKQVIHVTFRVGPTLPRPPGHGYLIKPAGTSSLRGGLPLCAQHKMLSPPPVPYIRPSGNTGPPSSNHHLFHNLTRQKKREKMDPAPQVVVIQIKQGKEIGGGNHYCIICRVDPP
ncbi:hypothetical protein MJO29_008907, partial [Puccinia striiformis f. sp. tritici]